MKKIYAIIGLLAIAFSADAQRNLKLDFQIIRPSFDTNIVTGSTVNYQYRITNNSTTAADSLQVGDTVRFFDPSCTYDPTSTATIKFTSYVYFVATTSLPRGASINVTPSTPLAFANIENLAELATLPTLSYKQKPFVNNKQYAWFVLLYSVSRPSTNIAIASLNGNADTGRIWINKSTGLVEFANNKVENLVTYPNPATTQLSFEHNFEQEANAVVTVSDVAGRIVMRKEYNNNFGRQKFDLDINALSNGSYILQMVVDEKTLTSKFNVQK